ncbi:MAG TPA: hypothetical protein ENF73_06390 [Proteobacteria bacterium]|nr:hypothetical protein [Pseudomonadota bacterium]
MENRAHKDYREQLEALGKLVREAYEEGDLRAIAAAVGAPIEQEVKLKEITTLLLQQVDLKPGEEPKFTKRPKVEAYYIDDSGEAVATALGKEEVTFPFVIISANPMIPVRVLKHGNVGQLLDYAKAAGEAIRKKRDAKTISVFLAAVQDDMNVACTGGSLTDAALNEAISLLEDKELKPKYIVMRGSRFNDVRAFSLPGQIASELVAKGIIGSYAGAQFLLTSQMPADKVLIVPEQKVGKWAVREPLQTDPIEQKTKFMTGWLVWEEAAFGITNPDWIACVTITA